MKYEYIISKELVVCSVNNAGANR